MLKRALLIIAVLLIFSSQVSAQTESQSLILKPGFNFISFTVTISITPQQLKQFSSYVEDVYLYSAAAGSFLSVNEGTLTTIAAGKGYIIKSASAETLTLTIPGSLLANVNNITLKPGFNLVGFSKVPAAVKFSELMNAHSVIKGIYKWMANAGSFIAVVRNEAGVPVQLDGTDPSFKPGESYFINVTADTTINYDGANIAVGGSATNPSTAAPATIGGTLKAAAAAPASHISYAATGEEFLVTLTDFNGNVIPAVLLAAGETNPKTVKDGETYSFKTKDFTKSYKVIAKSSTALNKMLATFVGKVKENETVQQRDITPLGTALSLIYADSSKDASVFAREEAEKKANPDFLSKISPIVSDLEAKRKSSIQNAKFSDLSKLEQAYKDAVLGSANPVEIAKIREGLDAYIGEVEEQLLAAKKLKEALALVATSGRRQNESYVKESKDKLKSLISLELSDPLKDTVNENVYKEAKISYGLVCCDLGDIFKNKLSSQSMGAAKNSKNLLAAYQAVKGKLDPQAKALYEEGYNAVKDLKLDAEDKAAGLDKNASAALLKNASELAKEDPSKLNDAKVKADSILAKLDSEGKTSFTLPTGEIVDKNDVLEEKGNAFINGGKPSESVQIFNEVTDEKVKNFGLGQAYMQLNALDKAFLNLKEAVKSIVKSENRYEARMQAEENFEAVNEALFAFAALLDKLKNGSEEDVVNFRKAIEALEANYSADEKIFTDAGITVSDILSGIKPTTSFYEAGEGFINGTQTDFGGQFVEYETYADPLWAQYEKAQNLLFESGNLVESLKSLAAISDRERILFKGTSLAGTAEAPAEGTAVKYLNDAIAILESLHANASAENYLRCEAYYQSGMAYLSKYRAFKNANIKNKDLISRSLKTFFTIIEKSSYNDYYNLKWIAREMIGEAENERNEADGMSAGANQFMQDGENYMNRAKSFAYDGFTGEASADFETSFKCYYEAYSKVATSEIKLKEMALFYACSALYNKFKVDPQANAEDKDRAKRVLKNFSLEFANSSFLGEVRKMSGDLDTQFEIGGETYSEPSAQEAPGAEFERALALMDKLRMYYSNNFPASEIDPVIADAEAVFSAIFNAGQGAPDPKYFGTITSEVQVKSFKAVAKFQLAILYMERYFMSIDRNAAYKNLALRYFNELIMQNPEEYFIFDVKGFVESLQNEGKTEPVYDGGSPIISSVTLDPPSVRAGESSDFKVNVTADIMLPGVMDESGAASAVTTVEAQLFRFGNLVYSDEQMSVPVKTTLTLVNSRWTGSLIIPAAAVEPGPYDIAVTASADSGCADAYVPFSVKTADGSASISWIDTVGSDVLKVNVTDYPENVNNSYTDVYVTVLRADNSGQPELEGKFVPAEGVPANIKLERSTAENEIAYILELNRQVGDIAPGTYMFMFKLVKYDAANPDASLNNAVFSFPYSCYIEKVMPETDRNSIMKLYGGILSNYNDLTLSPEQRVAAIEAMHSPAGFKYGADARAALLEMLSSIDGMKVTAEDESYISYSPDGKATLYSYLRVDGVYKTDVAQGVFMPDGRMLLQPGYAGSKLYDFYISFEQSFVKAAEGSWALSPSSDSGSAEPQPETGDAKSRNARAAK